jgi:DNA-binding winged helix-turn-helix (wHTH) protein/TolB-like protein/tetratricopeptide (TPR) repeat protein
MSADRRLTSIDLAHERPFALGGLEVRPAKLEVVAGDRREALEPRVMQVLVALARERGEVVSRDDLIQSCWGGRIVGEDSIQRCIGRLRALARRLGSFEIETVQRVGYRLTQPSPAGPTPRRGHRLAWVAAGLAAMALVAAAAGIWAARRSVVGESLQTPRVAVAGFRSLSDDPPARAFAGTLGDAAAGVLGRYALAVIKPAAEADMVLGGSVVHDGAIWRVRAHLEDVRSGFTLWSQDFERPVGQEDPLRDQVTVAVADAVMFAMEPLRQPGLKLDPRTVALFIRAGKINSTPDPKEAGQSQQIMEEVVSRAPEFAAARGVLALDLVNALRSAPESQRQGLRDRARVTASEAIRQDPKAAGAAYDGLYLLARMDQPTAIAIAEDGLLKGLAADPDYPWLQMRECRVLSEVGRAGEALRHCERARAVRPLSAPIDWSYAQALKEAGQRENAVRAAEEAARYHPDSVGRRLRFELAAFAGSPDRALALLPDLRRPPQVTDEQGAEALMLFLTARASGTAADADRALGALWASARAADDARWLVFAAATLGRPDEAFRALDEFGALPARASLGVAPGILLDSAAAPLRGDPRFWRAAAKAGYLDYWRTRGVWPDFCVDPHLPFSCKVAASRITP